MLATVPVGNTGGWQSWTSRTVSLTGSATGVHKLYAVARGGGGADLGNINWFQFNH
ncbi:carbohydrate-binding protein [Streptomyces sp. NPDC002540]